MSDDNEMTTGSEVVRADAAARAVRAWHLRISGVPWDEVAEVCGFANASNALRAVRNYLGELPQMDREDVRRLWRTRHEELWRLAQRDAHDRRAGAVRSAVAVARSAAQLDGLDAPTNVVVSPDAEAFERVVRAAVEAQRGAADLVEMDVVAMPEDDPAAEQ